MAGRRTPLFGGTAGAALGVIVAPRRGESRRAAFTRLRLSLRPGRGSLSAFAGTPCAQSRPASAEAAKDRA
jgi:gas vesicle protein